MSKKAKNSTKSTKKCYAAYPRHQDLGIMIAIRDLDRDVAEIFRRLASGGDCYDESKKILQERQAQLHAIKLPTNMVEGELNDLVIEFQAAYTFVFGILQALGPLSPRMRQAILERPDSKLRMRALRNHYTQLMRIADKRRSQREMELEYLYDE